MSIEITTSQHTSVLIPKINCQLRQLITSSWFDIDHWKLRQAVIGQAKGRYVTWFVAHDENEWVLRHYYRGGMVARVVKDRYVFRSMQATRCYRELELLEQMYRQGLPVPKPIAARVIRQGLFYRADILVEKIPHALDLAHLLAREPLSQVAWLTIGAMIGKFHVAGIYHADLNAHNILRDDQARFWLIDFDRCENRTLDIEWQKANLNRLKRSFFKEKKRHSAFYFDDMQWQWLMQGYARFTRRDISDFQ